MKARYCGRCGAELRTREIESRDREVCPRCGTIAYENPLPVAAALVLNDEREVLLVKRRNEPHQGHWCLPTGFAEAGESIEEAALRELEEEAGIQGRTLRLLDAASQANDYYGDLLFVIFEVEKQGGEEMAGDDAEELGYFPLDAIPSLAFPPHEKALRLCADWHRDEWAIQDSFNSLQEGGERGVLSDPLLLWVRDRAGEITRRWWKTVLASPSTTGYRKLDPGQVQGSALEALSQFSDWLWYGDSKGEVARFYHELGRRRRDQGLPAPELLSALTLLRREIWILAREEQVLQSTLDVYRVMELSRRIVHFFDKALYHAAAGMDEDPGTRS